MADYFTVIEMAQILKGYEKSISGLKAETFNQYSQIIGDFLRNIALEKIEKNDYKSFFSSENINRFRKMRRSIIVSSALKRLLIYFISSGYIEKGFDFEFSMEQKEKNNYEFLSLEEIKYIFTDASFETENEKLISQAICALACFCFFEQKHIKALKLSDVLIDSKLIRNLRVSEEDDQSTGHLMKWLKLNDVAFKCVNAYLKDYRKQIRTECDEFFVYEGQPINNVNGVNSLLYAFDRKANRDKVSKVNIQLLYSSTLLYWLTSTKGKALSKVLQIIEVGNQQWQKAFKYYMENYSSLENYEGVIDISDFEVIEMKHLKEESQLDSELEIDDVKEELCESEENMELVPYSEEVDITMEQVLDFDSINRNNLENKAVTIERLVRDTAISRKLKNLYGNRCQLCGYKLRSSNGNFMSEAHHIQPYNRIHKGDDTFKNLIVLCPNCHSQFDQLFYAINPQTLKVHCLFEDDQFHLSDLEMIEGHSFGEAYLQYMWELFVKKMKLL